MIFCELYIAITFLAVLINYNLICLYDFMYAVKPMVFFLIGQITLGIAG